MDFKPVWLIVNVHGEVEQDLWYSEEDAFDEACRRERTYKRDAPFTVCEVSELTALKRYEEYDTKIYEVVFDGGLRKRFCTHQEALDYGNSMSNQGRIKFKVLNKMIGG